MDVTVRDVDNIADIENALDKEWAFSDISQLDDTLYLYGEGWLCGGESEEEFVDRIAQSAWEANEGYCEVEVEAACLDDLPYNHHIREKEQHDNWRNNFS